MKRTIWVLIGLIAVLAIIAGVSFKGALVGTRTDPEAARFAEREVNLHTVALTQSFNFSKSTPLFQDNTFPRLDLPVLRGHKPNWQKASVVTVGTSASSSALELYDQLADQDIQKVHILSSGPYVPAEFEAFPTDVLILDGTGGSENLNVSDELHEALGVFAFTSGYLLNADRTVLFAQVNKGNFSGLNAAVKGFITHGPSGVAPNTQQLLPIGEPLPLTAVPAEFREELQTALTKPITLVFLSDPSWCDTCGYWLHDAKSFIKTWQAQGYGLVLIKGGGKAFSLTSLPDGVTRLSDVHLPDSATESQVLSSWGMTGIPATMVLKDGVLQGEVPWLEVEVDGTAYRNIHFRAVEKIAKAVETASAELRNIAFRYRAHIVKAYSKSKVEG